MEIYLQEVLVATFVKLEPSVRAKLDKLAQGFAGVLEAVVDFWKHGVPTKTWHLLLRGVTGHDAGDAGDGWQNLFGDGLKRPP